MFSLIERVLLRIGLIKIRHTDKLTEYFVETTRLRTEYMTAADFDPLLTRFSEPYQYFSVPYRRITADAVRFFSEMSSPDHYIDVWNHQNTAKGFRDAVETFRSQFIVPEEQDRFFSLYRPTANLFIRHPEYHTTDTEWLCHILGSIDHFVAGWNHQFMARKFLTETADAKQDYIPFHTRDTWLLTYGPSFQFLSCQPAFTDADTTRFCNEYFDLKALVQLWNREYLDRMHTKHDGFLSNIEGWPLDFQQREAVLTDEDSTLVVAGAGCGKTLTIVGKVKFLIEVKKVNPRDILLLSFSKATVSDMKDRLVDKLGFRGLTVRTFHSLGLNILNRESADDDGDLKCVQLMKEINTEYLRAVVPQEPRILKDFIRFFGCYLLEPLPAPKEGNGLEPLRQGDTLSGLVSTEGTKHFRERVSSVGENMIANYLYLNGIDYSYKDRSALGEVSEDQIKPPTPLFYLPDYKIAIEHLPFDRNGVPLHRKEFARKHTLQSLSHLKTALDGAGATLIETYTWQVEDDSLLAALQQSLSDMGVPFYPVTEKELYHTLSSGDSPKTARVLDLFTTFLTLFKSNHFRDDQFDVFLETLEQSERYSAFQKERHRTFLSLARRLFEHYETTMRSSNFIDFNDMINEAADLLPDCDFGSHFKYIFIDEYQDTSKSRFNLANAIREKSGAKVFCVGDDWQSIYRFAGSDIRLFTDMQTFFGETQMLRIEQTHRNAQELIDIAGWFVSKNPRQFKKSLKSSKRLEHPLRIFSYVENRNPAFDGAVNELIALGHGSGEVLVLGRTHKDLAFLKERPDYQKAYGDTFRLESFPEIRFVSLTAHRSKGLGMKNTILVSGDDDILGFPIQFTDDSLLDYVLTDADGYLYEEERRLFYVAITRTMNYCFVLAKRDRESVFLHEIREQFEVPWYSEDGANHTPGITCPVCGRGRLILRNQKFVGCSTFPACEFRTKNISVLHSPTECPHCEAPLKRVPPKGPPKDLKYEPYYRCIDEPSCTYKILESALFREAADIPVDMADVALIR